MTEAVASSLRAWESFYVIVGSSAGALTGLQFVVMTLIGEAGTPRNKDTLSAFGSPNVVHFCAALLVSAILSAPWGSLTGAGVALAACGVLGLVYSVIVVRRAHRQRGYQPVFEDWVWHTILPLVAYGTLFVTGVTMNWGSADALFVVGAAVLLLVFIGIHNAWDTVTYVVTGQGATHREATVAGDSPVPPPPVVVPGAESEPPPATPPPQ
ncbi:MAG TPA: hypothetical protein VJY35_03965 [Candidatus Eisenbacteria bacterium]|nr:hypothetical protein [Candidatus Eisenbacteria bacterium]